jgi:hypothetical protein
MLSSCITGTHNNSNRMYSPKAIPGQILLFISISLLFVLLVDVQERAAYSSPLNNNTLPVITNSSSDISVGSVESIHNTETLKVPREVDVFVTLIANEAHESWKDERHKLITDRNAYYIPTKLVIHEGTAIVFLDADAPWDTPHPQTLEIVDKQSKDVVYSTGILDYSHTSEPVQLSPGNYSLVNTEYDAKEGNILVLPNEGSEDGNNSSVSSTNDNLIVGGFYTTTNQVENIKDNDGVSHPGSLKYFREQFEKNGFNILSEHSFSYGVCDYCPGGFWPDNKSGDHTLIIYSTQQPLSEALDKLERLVKDNVYV